MRFLSYKKITLGELSAHQFTLFESKSAFSVIFYHFVGGGWQDRFHTHAFNAWSIKLYGSYQVREIVDGKIIEGRRTEWFKFFAKTTNHMLGPSSGCGTLLFAGPWEATWQETKDGRTRVLGWGRQHVSAPPEEVDEMIESSERPSFDEVYMHFAESIALRSTCRRRRVGTVITSLDHRKVLAIGYNGNASGLPNTCDRDESGNCGCLHSEENAVINCDSPRDTQKLVYVTHEPCPACAKRLINLGNVVRVVYKNEFSKKGGVELMRSVGIVVEAFRDLVPNEGLRFGSPDHN